MLAKYEASIRGLFYQDELDVDQCLILESHLLSYSHLYICFQVIHLQPHTLFINRVGMSICLQQCDCQTEEWINPSDPPKLFGWQSSTRIESLKVCEISSDFFKLILI